MTRMTRTLGWSVAVVSVLAGIGAPLLAQSGLERVEQLTRLGRTEEARGELLTWWDGGRADAPRRELQRGLWLRGRLTVDPIQAKLDFRRLAVLYPSGQFTPNAILRLAQASFAMGDEEEARGYIATLVRDYPRSDAREQGEAWLADAGPVPPPGDTPTRALAVAPEREAAVEVGAPADRPPRRTRPVDEPEMEPELTAEADAALDDAAPEAEPVMNYYVQLGAFADEARALALFEEVSEAGVEVRVVRVEGSLFTHVRVGRFAQREAAVQRLDELAASGISAALVRDDRAEAVVRN